MGCLNAFLGVWLSIWTVAVGGLIHGYFHGGKMDDGAPMPLWFVMAFVIPWLFVALMLLYSKFARKTFRLTSDALHIETRLLGASWALMLPRDTITRVKQVKDGGEGDDSFPSWGLELKSAARIERPMQRLSLLNNFGRNVRFRSVLSRLPYDHSAWLGNIIAQWAGVELELCQDPTAE